MLFPSVCSSGYGPLTGTLARYSPNFPLTTFISPPASPHPSTPSFLIHVGGLSDSLLPTPYTAPLQSLCSSLNYHFLNPILRSSSLQFGFNSLTTDTEDLLDLLDYLHNVSKPNKPRVVLVGHSTGCQDAVHLLRTSSDNPLTASIVGVVLQASASDRECDTDNSSNVKAAEEMVEGGRGGEFMPRDAFWAPITAERFVSLYGQKADGDSYFCSDLSDAELDARLGHLKELEFAVCAYSMADEYVPAYVDRDVVVDRLCKAGGMEALKLAGANHNLSLPEDGGAVEKLMECIGRNLKAIDK